jgi:hypothetical protein
VDAVESSLTLSAEDLDGAAAEMPENVRVRRIIGVYGLAAILYSLGLAWLADSYLGEHLIPAGIGLGIIVYAQLRRPAAGARAIAAMRDGERDVSYRFDEHGLRIKTAASDASLSYSMLHRFVDGESAFLLYTQERIAQIIPKRAFDSGQIERIRHWLGTQVKPRPRPNVLLRWVWVWVVLVVLLLAIWQLYIAPSS